MSFVVEITKNVTVHQGPLPPLRGKQSKPLPEPAGGFELTVKVGVMFGDKQLKKSGTFVDSAALDALVAEKVQYLASDTWIKLFDFRPTFELVSQWFCNDLKAQVKQLEYVELENHTLGITTQYIP